MKAFGPDETTVERVLERQLDPLQLISFAHASTGREGWAPPFLDPGMAPLNEILFRSVIEDTNEIGPRCVGEGIPLQVFAKAVAECVLPHDQLQLPHHD